MPQVLTSTSRKIISKPIDQECLCILLLTSINRFFYDYNNLNTVTGKLDPIEAYIEIPTNEAKKYIFFLGTCKEKSTQKLILKC